MIDPDEAPSITRTDLGVCARLSFRWVSDVWARGLTVLLGRFVLALTEIDAHRLELTTVGTDLLAIRPLTIELGSSRD